MSANNANGTHHMDNKGFSDVEMGPLLANSRSTHERKKKVAGLSASAAALGGGGDAEKTLLSTSLPIGGKDASPAVAASGSGAVGTGGKVLSACALYSICSVAMVLDNKSLASR